jgi:5-methylcytosine-specific restriction endonuclease McrA
MAWKVCRANNPERFKEHQDRSKRKFRALHPDRDRAARQRAKSRRRARQYGAGHERYNRADIFAAYGGTCAYCDAPAEHLDHVVAISRGGADAAHNLLPACAPCNLSKSAKSLAEWAATF